MPKKKKLDPMQDHKDREIERSRKHIVHLADERTKKALRNFNGLDFQELFDGVVSSKEGSK